MQNGGFLIAKVLVGAFSVKLCEGSLTALLDTRHLFMSRYNIITIWNLRSPLRRYGVPGLPSHSASELCPSSTHPARRGRNEYKDVYGE